jgi:SAM-dependent methyltransferase
MKKHRKAWFDNEALWRETYSYMFPESRFAGAAETMDQALQLTGIVDGSVLDLCCGPGRCSLALAARGLQITGVDRTKFLLDKARAFSRAARLKIEWVQEDMRDFSRADSYDLALSMYTSFGYFENRGEDEQVLLNVLHSLRSRGVLLNIWGFERSKLRPELESSHCGGTKSRNKPQLAWLRGASWRSQ